MGILQWLSGARADPAPSAPGLLTCPTLTIALFGSRRETPDLERVHTAFLEYVRTAFPATPEEWATNRDGVLAYYQEKVAEKLDVVEVPDRSELGFTDMVSRLFSPCPRGMVWLLLENRAAISERDATLVPNVLSEFNADPRCAMVQGNGWHAFVRERHMLNAEIDAGALAPQFQRFGYSVKRVNYLSIDARRKGPFALT